MALDRVEAGRLTLRDAILQFHDEGDRAAGRAFDALKKSFDALFALLQFAVNGLHVRRLTGHDAARLLRRGCRLQRQHDEKTHGVHQHTSYQSIDLSNRSIYK